MNLLKSVGGLGSEDARVRGWHKSIKFWREWRGSKSCCGSKIIFFTFVPFLYMVGVPYMRFFLSLTFVCLYSLRSVHIQIGVGLKLYTELNPG